MDRREADYPHHVNLAVCAGPSVRLWNPQQHASNAPSPGEDSGMLWQDSSLGILASAVSWNRNNKVVAVGMENGQVQIRYASGKYMNTLKGQGDRAVSGLSWSTGSKTLVVGCVGGQVRVHDMTARTCVSADVYGTEHLSQRAIGVQHHPDDAFVAIGGREKVGLYSLKMDHLRGECVCSASAVVKNDACFPSVSVGTGKPYLAAGSDKNGIVAVWDYMAETEIACDKFRHAHKGPCKVALAPLEPFLLYSVGMDGLIKMQDLRSPSSIASPTSIASVSTTMGVSSISVHEHTGDVAVGTSDGNVLIFQAGLVSRKPKQTIYFGDMTKHGSDVDCPILDIDWQHSFHNVSLHAKDHVTAIESHSLGTASREQQQYAAPSGTPRSSSLPDRSTLPQKQKKEFVPAVDHRRQTLSSASSLIRRGDAEQEPESSKESTEPWRIPAAQQTEQAEESGTSSPPPRMVAKAMVRTPISGRPVKEKLPGDMEPAKPPQVKGTGNDDISQLILALHLDMVTMFEHQEKKTDDLMKHIMDRQDALHKEVQELKDTLNQVLTRRSEASWI